MPKPIATLNCRLRHRHLVRGHSESRPSPFADLPRSSDPKLEAPPSVRATLRFLALLASASMAMVPCPAQSLREQADSLGFNMGAAVRPSLFSEKAYSATLAREFNMVEGEDAMKWWVIRPDQKTFDFTQGDQVVAFADTHRMKVRGHTLVWG